VEAGAGQEAQPVAWGALDKQGRIWDACYDKNASDIYTVPLYAAPPQAPAAVQGERILPQIRDSLEIMLASAVTLGSEYVEGYQIKTGALHRIIGLMQEAGYSVTVPLPSPPQAAQEAAAQVERDFTRQVMAQRDSLADALDETLRERDNYCEWADKLADAIAEELDVDIGEHSSGNNPWLRALEALDEARNCTCHPDDNPPRPCARQYALNECRQAAQQAEAAPAQPANTLLESHLNYTASHLPKEAAQPSALTDEQILDAARDSMGAEWHCVTDGAMLNFAREVLGRAALAQRTGGLGMTLAQAHAAAMERIRTLEAQRDAAWNEAIEAAAIACEAEQVEIASIDSDGAYNLATEHCAAAIRALKRHDPSATQAELDDAADTLKALESRRSE
jgi:hypothetical protein